MSIHSTVLVLLSHMSLYLILLVLWILIRHFAVSTFQSNSRFISETYFGE